MLSALGVDDTFLANRHGPCPICGGKDRFRFDDKEGRGTFYCSQCGPGDGFKLLQLVNGWSFMEALKTVAGQLGMDEKRDYVKHQEPVRREPPKIAELTQRVKDILRVSCDPMDVPECVAYLDKRKLLPMKSSWRAVPALDCFRKGEGKSVTLEGRYPAMVATITDYAGERVSAHVTYLGKDGNKAAVDAPKKILSPLTGRVSCAARLMKVDGDRMGIAEGIETALSAAEIFDMPVWAALNTTLMRKFVPPPGVRHVTIFADKDVEGLDAAWDLAKELEGRCTVDMERPKKGDWNDYLREQKA